jgi:hypothetical protein
MLKSSILRRCGLHVQCGMQGMCWCASTAAWTTCHTEQQHVALFIKQQCFLQCMHVHMHVHMSTRAATMQSATSHLFIHVCS